jgi:nitrilase
VYADIHLSKCVVPTQFQDVVGYYNRFDVFELKVNRRSLLPVHFIDDGKSDERSVVPHLPPLEGSGIADTEPLSDRS